MKMNCINQLGPHNFFFYSEYFVTSFPFFLLSSHANAITQRSTTVPSADMMGGRQPNEARQDKPLEISLQKLCFTAAALQLTVTL